MIYTDKYEGHNAPWKVIEYIDAISAVGELNTADAQLITDAPKLLAEVKRLRERVKTEKNLKLWEKAEVKRLRETIKAYLDLDMESLEFCRIMREMGVIE